jgi:Leucine-rich repeat (LRR) protein
VVLAVFGVAGMATAQILPAEREALIALYNSTDGDNWTNTDGWMGAAGTECDWYGVTCDGGGTTVVELSLRNNNLSGTIPAALSNLGGLTILNLNYNQLSGGIPSALGSLSNLESLTLQDNQLNGSIPPELGNLANLGNLNLSGNELNGSNPA